MSWNAYLVDDRGHLEGDWNYTHNCNGMANEVCDQAQIIEGKARWWERRDRPDMAAEAREEGNRSWWATLDDMDGPVGAAFLDRIIRGLEADPERFRAMNPPNGWGDYDSLVKVLTAMRNAVPEWPTKWYASG